MFEIEKFNQKEVKLSQQILNALCCKKINEKEDDKNM
jgi:hypothetical protein